ncbi:2'-5' RNA ligase family protein, partial [Micromonospora provocatoris]
PPAGAFVAARSYDGDARTTSELTTACPRSGG